MPDIVESVEEEIDTRQYQTDFSEKIDSKGTRVKDPVNTDEVVAAAYIAWDAEGTVSSHDVSTMSGSCNYDFDRMNSEQAEQAMMLLAREGFVDRTSMYDESINVKTDKEDFSVEETDEGVFVQTPMMNNRYDVGASESYMNLEGEEEMEGQNAFVGLGRLLEEENLI